jgi:hypothetical protein
MGLNRVDIESTLCIENPESYIIKAWNMMTLKKIIIYLIYYLPYLRMRNVSVI